MNNVIPANAGISQNELYEIPVLPSANRNDKNQSIKTAARESIYGGTARTKIEDETLFGLLSVYKFNITYIRVLESEENDRISVQMTDNPRRWSHFQEEKFRAYHLLSRLEMGVPKLSIKFLNPTQVLLVKGPLLGMRIPHTRCDILQREDSGGIHLVETSLLYRDIVLRGVRSLLTMTPHRKFEIIEKSIDITVQRAEAEG